MKKKISYKPLRVGDLWSNHFIEYEINDDGNKLTLSIKEYHNKIRTT